MANPTATITVIAVAAVFGLFAGYYIGYAFGLVRWQPEDATL
jgi:hypothetical protein